MNQDIGNLYSSKDTKTKLSITYNKIRSQTKLLAKKLTLDDQCVQSMPNASPTKWHLAHTTWFFETFILKIHVKEYEEYNTDFNFLFNSYYEQIGARQSMANASPKKSHLAHTREPNQVYLPKFLLPSGPLAVHRVQICKRRWNVDQETS